MPLEARLVGDFKGWTGKTVFRLDNGQVWREVEDGRLRFKKGQKVRIELGLLSTYKLHIVGRKLSVKVKRTK